MLASTGSRDIRAGSKMVFFASCVSIESLLGVRESIVETKVGYSDRILVGGCICHCFPTGPLWSGEDDVPAHLHISIWFVSTDAGSDQLGAGNMMARDVDSPLHVWFFRQFCLLHQTALITKRLLSNLNPYWGQLAKLVNLWRIISRGGDFCRQHSLQPLRARIAIPKLITIQMAWPSSWTPFAMFPIEAITKRFVS
jgi:hypothetical protein